MNVSESIDTVTVLRALQGLRRADGTPTDVEEVVAACERLAQRAGKSLMAQVPCSRVSIIGTLDHLAELDEDEA